MSIPWNSEPVATRRVPIPHEGLSRTVVVGGRGTPDRKARRALKILLVLGAAALLLALLRSIGIAVLWRFLFEFGP